MGCGVWGVFFQQGFENSVMCYGMFVVQIVVFYILCIGVKSLQCVTQCGYSLLFKYKTYTIAEPGLGSAGVYGPERLAVSGQLICSRALALLFPRYNTHISSVSICHISDVSL